MKVFYTIEVAKLIEELNHQDQARLERTRKLFEDYGFQIGLQIGLKYIKKIAPSGIWELRAGKIRLFLFLRGNTAVGVHVIYKKTQKLSVRDIKLAEVRSKNL